MVQDLLGNTKIPRFFTHVQTARKRNIIHPAMWIYGGNVTGYRVELSLLGHLAKERSMSMAYFLAKCSNWVSNRMSNPFLVDHGPPFIHARGYHSGRMHAALAVVHGMSFGVWKEMCPSCLVSVRMDGMERPVTSGMRRPSS
jgi:hypothetical protein